VDSRYTHIGINQQLVKNKRIQIKLVDFSFKVFNADGTKNGEVAKIASLEVKINRHKKYIEVAVTNLKDVQNHIGQNIKTLSSGQDEHRQWTTRITENRK